ncbi:MAG TPA: hypothetical protein VI981_01265 [Candidatus Paceibacterota bacterium]
MARSARKQSTPVTKAPAGFPIRILASFESPNGSIGLQDEPVFLARRATPEGVPGRWEDHDVTVVRSGSNGNTHFIVKYRDPVPVLQV